MVSGVYNLTKVAWNIKKAGAPTVNITCRVYLTDVLGKPTGSALATSTPKNCSTLTTSFVWYNFSFPTPYTLNNGTWYSFDLEVGNSGMVSLSNAPIVQQSSSNVVSGYMDYWYSSAWRNPDGSRDYGYYIYGYRLDSPLYVTVFWNNVSGGIVANSTVCSNGSSLLYYNQSSIMLSALTPSNTSISFMNWTYDGSSSTSNPFILLVDGNYTVWGNFETISGGTTTTVYYWSTFLVVGVFIGAMFTGSFFLIKRNRKNEGIFDI